MARARGGKSRRGSSATRRKSSTASRRARDHLKAIEARQRARELEWQQTVEADQRRRRQLAQTLEGKLYHAMEAMQDRVAAEGYEMPVLTTRRPSSANEYEAGVSVDESGNRRDPQNKFVWKSPWALVGRIAFRDTIGYADLHAILDSWVEKKGITDRIGNQRHARIRVEYVDAQTGERGEYQLAETFAWGYGLERAISKCNPDHSDGLGKRYARSIVVAVVLWFSSSTDANQQRFVKRR